MSGKGSKPRPKSVSDEVFSNNFDSIFPRDSKKEVPEVLTTKEFDERMRKIDDDFINSLNESPLDNAGYESCKETDTDRTDAAKNRALVNR